MITPKIYCCCLAVLTVDREGAGLYFSWAYKTYSRFYFGLFEASQTVHSKSLSTSTLSSPQVQSPGPLLPFTAAQSVCTIATDGNQSTPSVTIYSSQRLPYGHTSTLDNASGLNSFHVPSLGQLNAGGILGNQTFRPDVTSAPRIQTDQEVQPLLS